ncbi:MAG: transposase domain-containing protein [Sulfuricellaceae bacterium]|nr:transposase domain-containing protein [Sulfuricellaceae bacterium]
MTVSYRKGTDPELTSDEAADLLCISGQAVRASCAESRYPAAHKDPSGSWRIPLSSLPALAQAKYWAQNMNIAPGGWLEEDRRELSEDAAEKLWEFFEGATLKRKAQAYKDAEACHAWQIMAAKDIHYQVALDEIKKEFGLPKSTVYDKINRIKGYDPQHWPALLVGQWKGENARQVEWHAEAWKSFLRESLTPNRPIKTAWNRTKRLAAQNGWGAIPSYDTAKNDFRKLDHDVVTFIKEGETALKVKSPTAIREYDMAVHDIWSLDGRRKDLFVYDHKGKYVKKRTVFRLYIVAIEELRSRMLVGYALGGALDADLVRAAFLDALKTTGRIIPREIQMDNGMENAAKEISGGAPWRRRGKVLADEIPGLFPMNNIAVTWPGVAHGQAKPVERLFGTLAQMAETRPEFRGAYCGNSPEMRPEECDASKAVPVELVEQILAEEIAAYHRTPHRGNGMDDKSPMQVYVEQMNKPGVVCRKITPAELRLCAYSATAITIRKDATFTIMGAAYWSEGTAKLAQGKGYYARYNPHNLSDPVYVYHKEKLLCEAKKKELTSFNDKAEGKAIMKARATYTKAVKTSAKALQALSGSDSREYLNALAAQISPEIVDKETGEVLPGAKVLEITRGKVDTLPDGTSAKELEREKIARLAEEFEQVVAAASKKHKANGGK